jgi:hypothetical protein
LLQKFLLLLHGSFHGFISSEHFLLHFVEPLESFGGLLFFLLFDLLLGLELFNESRFFFFRHLSLSFDFSLLFLELLPNLFLLVLDLVFHLLHLLLVFDVGDLLTHDNATSIELLGLARLSEVDLTARKLCKLFSEAGDFITEFSDHSVLRILVNTRLVLNTFGARSISKSRKSFLRVVICRSDGCDHDSLRVTTQGVL